MTKRPMMNGKAIDRVFTEMLNLLQDHHYQDLLKEALQMKARKAA